MNIAIPQRYVSSISVRVVRAKMRKRMDATHAMSGIPALVRIMEYSGRYAKSDSDQYTDNDPIHS